MLIKNKDIFIVIGAGHYQTALIKEIKKMGYRVLVVDKNRNAPGILFADFKIVCDSYDFERVYHLISKLINKESIAGVITQASRGAIVTTAYLAEKFNAKWLNFRTALLTINKVKMSRKYNKEILLNLNKQNKEFIKNKIPVVVKNQTLSGSLGILKLKTEKDIDDFFKINRNFKDYLMEEYIEGRHFMLYGIKTDRFLKIYGIAEKIINDEMKTLYVYFPAEIDSLIKEKIYEFTKQLLSDLHFDFGPFMVECFMRNDKKIFLAEIEASLQGSYFSEYMIPMTTGDEPIIDTINAILGKKVKKRVSKSELFYIQKYYYPKSKGLIKKIEISNCDSQIILRKHVLKERKIINKNLYFFNTILIGNTKEKNKFMEMIDKCKVKLIIEEKERK